mmetsp:Transcript_23812/g.38246  ORF Transcript_23812/g.38246 Transcript_23812/m.38246 type:complete len:128 (-) Transcript_23812:569-952(-)
MVSWPQARYKPIRKNEHRAPHPHIRMPAPLHSMDAWGAMAPREEDTRQQHAVGSLEVIAELLHEPENHSLCLGDVSMVIQVHARQLKAAHKHRNDAEDGEDPPRSPKRPPRSRNQRQQKYEGCSAEG